MGARAHVAPSANISANCSILTKNGKSSKNFRAKKKTNGTEKDSNPNDLCWPKTKTCILSMFNIIPLAPCFISGAKAKISQNCIGWANLNQNYIGQTNHKPCTRWFSALRHVSRKSAIALSSVNACRMERSAALNKNYANGNCSNTNSSSNSKFKIKIQNEL